MMRMAELLEIFMVVSFGVSWPMNIVKSLKTRSAKGKSLAFLGLILFGYACGILSKVALIAGGGTVKWYVLFFYVLNFVMVGADMALYFRNRRLDRRREREGSR